MDFSGMMSELQGVRELISCFVVAFYLAIVLILILPCLWIEGDDGCVKLITKMHHIQGMLSIKKDK